MGACASMPVQEPPAAAIAVALPPAAGPSAPVGASGSAAALAAADDALCSSPLGVLPCPGTSVPTAAAAAPLLAGAAGQGADGPTGWGSAATSLVPRRSGSTVFEFEEVVLSSGSCTHSSSADEPLSELSLAECVGRGGFGRVFRGRWHQAPCAVKVMPTLPGAALGGDCRDVAAMEMAVLSMVQHPNIVQLYAHLTDMVKACAPPVPRARSFSGGGLASWSSGGFSRVAYRRMQPGEVLLPDAQPCNILVLEWCDRGSLRAAARAGLFHPPAPGGGAAVVDVGAALAALADPAQALAYVHGLRIAHGDVKLDNVLMRSDVMRTRGVTYKLADFGLARLLGETGAAPNEGCAGTLTHLAPELFDGVSPVTAAIDVYAFGVMMWDLYMGGTAPAYPGLSKKAIKRRVTAGARPEFPAGAPPAYEALARDCWAADPAARPSMADVVRRVEAMRAGAAAASPVVLPAPACAAPLRGAPPNQ